jgi:hypothetical protein
MMPQDTLIMILGKVQNLEVKDIGRKVVTVMMMM